MNALPPDILYEIWTLLPYDDIPSFALSNRSTYLSGLRLIQRHTALRAQHETLTFRAHDDSASDAATFLDHVAANPEVVRLVKKLGCCPPPRSSGGSKNWRVRYPTWGFLKPLVAGFGSEELRQTRRRYGGLVFDPERRECERWKGMLERGSLADVVLLMLLMLPNLTHLEIVTMCSMSWNVAQGTIMTARETRGGIWGGWPGTVDGHASFQRLGEIRLLQDRDRNGNILATEMGSKRDSARVFPLFLCMPSVKTLLVDKVDIVSVAKHSGTRNIPSAVQDLTLTRARFTHSSLKRLLLRLPALKTLHLHGTPQGSASVPGRNGSAYHMGLADTIRLVEEECSKSLRRYDVVVEPGVLEAKCAFRCGRWWRDIVNTRDERDETSCLVTKLDVASVLGMAYKKLSFIARQWPGVGGDQGQTASGGEVKGEVTTDVSEVMGSGKAGVDSCVAASASGLLKRRNSFS